MSRPAALLLSCLVFAVAPPAAAAQTIANTPQASRCDTARRGCPAQAPASSGGRAPPPASAAAAGAAGGDPFRSLGGGSPLCGRAVAGAGGRNCASSGALAHPYPIGNYAFDTHINTGVTRIESNLLMAVQTLALFVWLGLLYLLKGVLLALEWAFSLDLLGDTLSDLRRTMIALHQRVLGDSWLLFAIAVAGLWGIWRGLVQRQTIATVTGLASTVALMVCALVVIHSPIQTVGYATKLTNDAALGMLAGASTGSVDHGPRALGDATARVFDSLVLRPWCALQFADIRFCLARPPDDVPDDLKEDARRSRTVADLWLRFPAGGEQRDQLYERWRDAGDPLQPKVRMQKQDATPTRIALLVLITIGLSGALCLLGWMAFKLLVQAVLALVLLLFAPAMLLAPAFGDAGRQTFLAWAKRLVAAIVAKAIYALLLALVLVAAGLLAEFQRLGFIAVWLLQCVFWWGLFTHRQQILGFLTVAHPARHQPTGSGSVWRRARTAAATWALASQPVAAVAATVAAPARAALRARTDHADARRAATQAVAGEQLADRAGQVQHARIQAARDTVERHQQRETEREQLDRQLAPYDQRIRDAPAAPQPLPPSREERGLLARRAALDRDRPPERRLRQARLLTESAERSATLAGAPVDDRDRRRLIDQRRHDLQAGLPASHDRSLRWAGIDPADHRSASPAERARHEQQAHQAADRDRQLLAASTGDATEREIKLAARDLDPDRVRERSRRERERSRTERRQRQRRERLYRRR